MRKRSVRSRGYKIKQQQECAKRRSARGSWAWRSVSWACERPGGWVGGRGAGRRARAGSAKGGQKMSDTAPGGLFFCEAVCLPAHAIAPSGRRRARFSWVPGVRVCGEPRGLHQARRGRARNLAFSLAAPPCASSKPFPVGSRAHNTKKGSTRYPKRACCPQRSATLARYAGSSEQAQSTASPDKDHATQQSPLGDA